MTPMPGLWVSFLASVAVYLFLGSVVAVLLYLHVVSVPMGRDQADNAVRVVEAGAGLTLPARASSRALAAAVRRLLHEPSFTEGAQRMAEQIRSEVASDRAVSELEALA